MVGTTGGIKAPTPAVYIAYTAAVNPPKSDPVLSREQVWTGLEIKEIAAQDFVPAIVSTDVISKRQDDHGRPVTIRQVVFKEGNRRVEEEVISYHPTKVLFIQPDGSRVQNIISEGADGELYLTYDFEWLHDGMSDEDLEKKKEQYRQMSKTAVESTLTRIREMVKSGKIE